MSKAKTVMEINYSSLETGRELCLQRLSYKMTEKLFKKDEAQKPIKFLKTNIFKSHYKLQKDFKKQR